MAHATVACSFESVRHLPPQNYRRQDPRRARGVDKQRVEAEQSSAQVMQPTGLTGALYGNKRQMEAEDGVCSSQETTVTLGGPRQKQRVESLPTAAEAAAIAQVQARCDREEANATASGLLTAQRATVLATQALAEATATAEAAAIAAEAAAAASAAAVKKAATADGNKEKAQAEAMATAQAETEAKTRAEATETQAAASERAASRAAAVAAETAEAESRAAAAAAAADAAVAAEEQAQVQAAEAAEARAAEAREADVAATASARRFELHFALEVMGRSNSFEQGTADALVAAFDSAADGLKAVDAEAERLKLGLPSLAVALPPPGAVLLYKAHVSFPGDMPAAACFGPIVYTRTLLHEVLGPTNVLRVTCDDLPRPGTANRDAAMAREQRMLKNGLRVAGRLFKPFAFRDDDAGLFFFVAASGSVAAGSWTCVAEARALFADFENVKTLPKFTMRPQLALSQTLDARQLIEQQLGSLLQVQVVRHTEGQQPRSLASAFELDAPPLGCVQIVEVDDIRGDAGGLMTDGTGFISADLMEPMPKISHGRATPQAEGEAPYALALQMRLWYHGSLCKGTLARDARLPERTIVVSLSMRKVEGRLECAAASRGFWALEVIQTAGKVRPAYTNKQLVSLLEAAGGPPMVEALVALARQHETMVIESTLPPLKLPMLRKLADHDLNDYERCEREVRTTRSPTTLTFPQHAQPRH